MAVAWWFYLVHTGPRPHSVGRAWRVAGAALVAFAAAAAPVAESDTPLRRAGTLGIEQASGNECPAAARLQQVQLVATPAGAARVAGALFIGDELIKSFEGDPASPLRLYDPLVVNADAESNQIRFDRWPDPSTAQLSFQFFRHRCRVLAARIDFQGNAGGARLDTYTQTLADMATLAQVYAAGRAGDPCPGSAQASGLYERLQQRLGALHAVTLEARFVQMLNAQDTGNLELATSIGEELRDTLAQLYGANSGALARLRTPARTARSCGLLPGER